MDCQKTREKINRYIDGELDAGQAEAVELHLDACPDCRAAFARYGEVAGAVEGLDPVDPPGDFARTVRLAAEERRQAARRSFFLFPPRHAMPAPVRAAACIVLFFGLGMGALTGHSAFRSAQILTPSYADMVADEYFTTIPSDEITDTYLALIGYEE